ncbi:MAG: copper amine oxidase N-terminal domain-containing protein [Clostridiales bacterium]|nr:copper amine oxidase N-terminal domain-containing protein [Clostridiales bacterium]
MKRIHKFISTICFIIISFPMTGFAAEKNVEIISDSKYPITVEAERTVAFDNQELIPIDEILIKETSKDTFSANQEFIFSVKNKPLSVEDEKNSFNLMFEQSESVKNFNNNLKVEYKSADGNLIVTIKESDPNKIESFTLTNLTLIQNTNRVRLRTYSLYASSNSDTEVIPVVSDFVEIEEHKLQVEKEKLDIKIQINEKTFCVNEIEKALKVPAFISKNGYTMLPIREVTEVFPGTKVLWDNSRKEASILYGYDYVSIIAGANVMHINGEENVLKNAAEVHDGRMFVSLRDMCRIYNIPSEDIIWDNTTQTVYITTEVQK